MFLFKVGCVFLLATASHSVQLPPRKPGFAGSALGSILPSMSGWTSGGWISSTTTPPPTTGWPSTPPPTEAPTTGWPSTAPPTPPPTTGWPSTAPPTAPPPTGWPSTAPPPPSAGWPAPSGWSSPAPGWSSGGPVSLELLSESEVFGEGEAAATHGSETVVFGDSSNPAVASIQSGSSVGLGQGAGNMQMTIVNQNGESQTVNAIDNYNYGDATEYMGAALQGNTLSNTNGGASLVSGLGALGQLGLTLNNGGPVGWSSGK